MKDIYTTLINGIDESLTVSRIVRDKAWVGAELSNGSFGIAMNTEGDTRPRECACLIGMSAKRAAERVLSWNFDEASEAMAVINAYYNTPERMEALSLGVDYEKSCTEGLDLRGKRVAIIGHMKMREGALKDAEAVYIIERAPKDGDYPDSACEYLLPKCDVVIITGSAFINKTLPRLLELSEKAVTIIIGPTTPMSYELLGCNIQRLSGMAVTDKEGIIEWMQTVFGNPYPYGKKYYIG